MHDHRRAGSRFGGMRPAQGRMLAGALAAAAILGVSAAAGRAATDCSNPGDQTQMNICAAKSLAAADAELNKTYRKIVARLGDDADGLARLKMAERAWVAFRDAECKFQSSAVEGGSIQPMIQAGCLEKLTRERLAVFAGYLACEEGDLSCPVPPDD